MNKFTLLVLIITLFLSASSFAGNTVTVRVSITIPEIVQLNEASSSILEDKATGSAVKTEEAIRDNKKVIIKTVVAR